MNKNQVLFFVRRHLRALDEVVDLDQKELAEKDVPHGVRLQLERAAEANVLERDAIRAAVDFILAKMPEGELQQ